MSNRTRWIFTVGGGIMVSLPWWDAPWFLLLVGFVPLLFVEDDMRKNDGLLFSVLPLSFTFFFIWNLTVTWWLARIHFIGGMSVIILNAIIMSLVFMLYSAIKRGAGGGVAVLVILWTGFEFLHHRGDLSWPWLSLGNGLAGDIRMVQWFEFTGMTGGTVWVLLINTMLFAAIKHYRNGRMRALFIQGTFLALLIILPPVISLHLYNSFHGTGSSKSGFLLLQTVVDPYAEKSPGFSESEKLDELLSLAERNMTPEVGFIIAPETSVDSIWIDDPANKKILRIEEFLEQYSGTGMVMGATTFSNIHPSRKSFTSREDSRGNYFEVMNSALYFAAGNYSGVYHKHYLANGVEQIPFQWLFGFAGRFAIDLGGVSGSLKAGEGPLLLWDPSPAGVPAAGTLICFESSYGEYAADMVKNGAEILVVISNDGWFKNTGAYRQHLRLSRIRAVETRRDVLRAANAGISGLISGRGELTGLVEWWEEGAVIVYPSANDKITFFARSGDYLGRTALFFSVLMIINLIVVKLKSGNFRP